MATPAWCSAGYYVCDHSACSKKARNIDNWGRSSELLSGDHACCGHPKHDIAHANAARPPYVPPPPLGEALIKLFLRILDRSSRR